MPIGSDPEYPKKQAAIARGASSVGFEAAFPEYSPENPKFDLKKILEQFNDSVTVLADLTGERPSCYYELGLAEALGLPIEIFAKVGTDIHQTYFRSRARFYENTTDLEALTASTLRPYATGRGQIIAR